MFVARIGPTSRTQLSPLGHETDIFGQATSKAIIRFQEDHAAQILIPAGFTHGTGWFYDRKRGYVNQVAPANNER